MVLAHIDSVDISDCIIENADFNETILRSVNFRESSLTGTTFRYASLINVNIQDAILDDIDLSYIRCFDVKGIPKSTRNIRIDKESFDKIDNNIIKSMIEESSDVRQFKYKYDVALSFAGEDRHVAELIAKDLKKRNINVFYDEFEEANLWGNDLYEDLSEVYYRDSRYCLMIISRDYIRKQWTKVEKRAALARLFEEKNDYILPLRLDDSVVKGILPTMGYIDYTRRKHMEVLQILLDKLRQNK